jgi:signal transduction histidine kinase
MPDVGTALLPAEPPAEPLAEPPAAEPLERQPASTSINNSERAITPGRLRREAVRGPSIMRMAWLLQIPGPRAVNQPSPEIDHFLFAAGIGHELRNPLAVMDTSFFLLRQRLAQLAIGDPILQQQLQEMEDAIEEVKEAIDALLEVSRKERLDRFAPS